MGENGAGKSTLIKIISGIYQKDGGTLSIDGIPVDIHSAADSQKLGIAVIYQEFALIPELNIAQNAFLGKEKRKWNLFLSVPEMEKETGKYMDLLHLRTSVTRKVRDLSVSQQQMVEIAKAMGSDSWLVVMDEPTSAITDADKEELFKVIREMKAAGMAIVYVSHRMGEIFEICDDVTVLRDGEYIATKKVSETTEQELTRLMVGREVNDVFLREKVSVDQAEEPVFKVENLSRRGLLIPSALKYVPEKCWDCPA